jgi:hypothetical protein
MKISHLDNGYSFRIKLLIGFLVLFTGVQYFFGNYYKPAIHRVLESFLVGIFPKYYPYVSGLEKENADLKNQVSDLYALLKDAGVKEDFLQQGLTELIDANSVFGTHTILYDNLILDKGSVDGVHDNALVFGAGLLPVGYIQKSYINSSECVLLTTYKIETKAVVSVIDTQKSDTTVTTNSIGSTTDATNTNQQASVIKTSKQKDMNVTLIGDGAYGYYAILPESIQIATGTKLYLESNSNYSLGEVVSQIKNENEKVQKILVRSNFSPTSHTHFYIEK